MHAVVVPIVPAIAIKRILYATDFSTASLSALPLVATLARRYRSEVYVTHVRSPLPYTMATPEAVCVIEKKRETETNQAMDALFESQVIQGIACSRIMETGEPADEVRRAVRDHDIDLAVVGTHGRTGLMRLLMGSVAEELIRTLDCPVVTVGPHVAKLPATPESIKTIVYPTDLSRASHAAFPYVASLALEYQAKIVLLHTISARDVLSSIALETAALARKEVERAFCPEIDPRCDYEIVVDFGDPLERILGCARDVRADLIAMGVRQAGEAITHFRNSVAYKVVLNAECPVLTCRAK